MAKFSNSTIGVTGASGNLGRHVVKLLREAGAKHVVALTRDPTKFPLDIGDDLEVRQADFDQPEALATALAGVERLLIISLDVLPGRAERQVAAVDAAVKAGVGHIAYTSITSPYPDTHPDATIPNSHYWTETRIAASGADFSLLRNNLYADFLIPTAKNAIASGTHYHAGGAGGRAFITREDCGVAAAAMLLNAEGKTIYDIGGPEALTGDDLATLASRLSGKTVKAVNLPVDGLIAGMKQAGLPEELVGILARFDLDTAKGRLGVVSGDFEALTGRKPRSVADFLSAHKHALAG
jgi:NAD(P)H dehydrogenase (quinone)